MAEPGLSVWQTEGVRILLAFALGLLVGTERERRRADAGYTGFAGVRTFGLLGLLGGLLALLGGVPLVAVGAACVALFAAAAYLVHRDAQDRGLTTEIAMLVTYALGALAMREPAIAASATVLVTVTLALRAPLHRWVRDVVDEAEVRAILTVLVLALVLLPLMPDHRFGPYAAIHAPSLLRLVVILTMVQGVGHVGQRILGPRYGLVVAGFAGGFASSSATIAAMSMRARDQAVPCDRAIAGALASSVATSLQYLLVVASLDPGLLQAVGLPLATSGLVALLGALVFVVRSGRDAETPLAADRPIRLSAALGFAAVYAVVTVASAALSARFGHASVILVSGAAGLVDAHSTAGSIASLHMAGGLDAQTSVLACLAALSSNAVTKVLAAWSGRNVRFGIWTTAGSILVVASAWLAMLASGVE